MTSGLNTAPVLNSDVNNLAILILNTRIQLMTSGLNTAPVLNNDANNVQNKYLFCSHSIMSFEAKYSLVRNVNNLSIPEALLW